MDANHDATVLLVPGLFRAHHEAGWAHWDHAGSTTPHPFPTNQLPLRQPAAAVSRRVRFR